MEIVTLIVLGGTVSSMLFVVWQSRTFFERITRHVEEVIATEVRLQDDRIRKRLERTESDDRTEPGQPTDTYDIIPGRPVRRS